MNKTILVEYVFSLNRQEIKEFKLWLASPLMNQRGELTLLLDWIYRFRDAKDFSNMTKVAAFDHIFPKQPYDVKVLRYTMSFLLHQLRNYLVWKNIQANELKKQFILIQILKKRGLENVLKKQFEKTQKLLDNQPYRNHQYYFNQYQLYLEQYEFLKYQSRGTKMPLQEISETFIIFTISNILKWQCSILTYQSVKTTIHTTPFFQKVLDFIETLSYKTIPAIQIYYSTYKALTTQEVLYYQQLKIFMEHHFHQFPKEEGRDLLLLTINFCIKKINSGKSDYLKEVFTWYKKGFETNVLIRNGALSRFTYNNTILAGLKLGEFDWTRQLLENYRKFIHKKERYDTYHFNLALWHQFQGQYEEVLELLSKVKFKDVLHTLHAKELLLKIYYELGELDALESLLGSIKVYLYRHKQLGYHRQDYLKLIRYTKKLIQLNVHDTVAKQQFLEAVKKETSLLDKTWFLEQLMK